MELIDTQWDVNPLVKQAVGMPDNELIDTQWDVNVFTYNYGFLVGDELIDTQWDVNKDDSEIVIPLTRN